jgi:hypothetical protein
VQTKTKSELNAQFGIPFIQYDVKLYRVLYTTADVKGQVDTASALIGVPQEPGRVFPRLIYHHGTVGSKQGVPSQNFATGEGQLGGLFAGMGYVCMLPDLLGLGTSRGFHPYVHAASEASAALDLVRALPEFVGETGGFEVSAQLFVTGYSQGGHSAMATHRAIEQDSTAEFSITACAPLSGPYSISGVMRDLILSGNPYLYPAYVPNTILSYQTVYGNLFQSLSEVFKPDYSALIEPYYAGTKDLGTLNNQLIQKLTQDYGAPITKGMLIDSLLQVVATHPDHPFNVALRANDVYQWTPKAPTRLFYCMGDDQVPFMNSVVAAQTMYTPDAADFEAADVAPSANHAGCVAPALLQTLLFFGGYQQILSSLPICTAPPLPMTVAPNPATEYVSFPELPGAGTLELIDVRGSVLIREETSGAPTTWSLAGVPRGNYAVVWQGSGHTVVRFLIRS